MRQMAPLKIDFGCGIKTLEMRSPWEHRPLTSEAWLSKTRCWWSQHSENTGRTRWYCPPTWWTIWWGYMNGRMTLGWRYTSVLFFLNFNSIEVFPIPILFSSSPSCLWFTEYFKLASFVLNILPNIDKYHMITKIAFKLSPFNILYIICVKRLQHSLASSP